METPKGVRLSTFQPNWESSEENSNGLGPNLADNSSLPRSVLASMSSSNVGKESNFDTPCWGYFNGPRNGKASTNSEEKIKISGLGSFRKRLFAEEVFKKLKS